MDANKFQQLNANGRGFKGQINYIFNGIMPAISNLFM